MGGRAVREGSAAATSMARWPAFRVRLHHPHRARQVTLTSRIVLKKQDKGHNVESVVRDHIPKLQHGHDGLIFTCAQSGYVAGTDEKM